HPQVVTQHDHVRSAGFIVVAVDKTPALGSDSECFKESTADLSDLKLNRLTPARISQWRQNYAAKPAERLSLRLDVSEIRRRFIGPETDQSRRIVVRQRSQQHRVDDAEDRGVHANAESDRNHSHSRKSRTLREAAETIADVFNK